MNVKIKDENIKVIEFKPKIGDDIVLKFNYKDKLEMYMHRLFWGKNDISTTLELNKTRLQILLDILQDEDFKESDKYRIEFNDWYEGQLDIFKERERIKLKINEKYCYYEKSNPYCLLDEQETQKLCRILKSAYDKMI